MSKWLAMAEALEKDTTPEERAAIIEFEAGLPREQAEDMAANAQGFDNVVQFRMALLARGRNKD